VIDDMDIESLNFEKLVGYIRQVHDEMTAQAGRAVNLSLTLRNWLVGCYIAEYELCGLDRANYGDNLLSELAKRLTDLRVSNCNRRQLYRYIRFYRIYPEIVGTLSPQLKKRLPAVGPAAGKTGTASPQFRIAPDRLVHRLSYSHLELIVDLDDDLKRAFYEIECIHGNWSVRELKRQINSLYFERSGLSKDPKKLAAMTQKGAETAEPKLTVRDPYIFEFLGLKPMEAMSESHLEAQLLDKLQEFLLELGHGFCFEARQKRILIGNTHNFVDLVFYHRILKCHVLVELKVDEFNQNNVGQLNTYVSWYKKNMMSDGDSSPIGILLCTGKDHPLVEYALAGMDNQLFVSKYLLELPNREEMQQFIEQQLKESGGGLKQ
jgi:predicted nuclease of restriction endonuclease-like (RecB) superfamily